jgi:hypothetical protein
VAAARRALSCRPSPCDGPPREARPRPPPCARGRPCLATPSDAHRRRRAGRRPEGRPPAAGPAAGSIGRSAIRTEAALRLCDGYALEGHRRKRTPARRPRPGGGGAARPRRAGTAAGEEGRPGRRVRARRAAIGRCAGAARGRLGGRAESREGRFSACGGAVLFDVGGLARDGWPLRMRLAMMGLWMLGHGGRGVGIGSRLVESVRGCAGWHLTLEVRNHLLVASQEDQRHG